MSTPSTSKRILVVDDDPIIIKLAESRLKAVGYQVITSGDAPGGLELALKEKPDLIVLDVMMPIVNGYNFCRLLKTEDDHHHIPVIFLTSRDGVQDKQIGKEVGADAYITKPLNVKELLDKIEELLEAV